MFVLSVDKLKHCNDPSIRDSKVKLVKVIRILFKQSITNLCGISSIKFINDSILFLLQATAMQIGVHNNTWNT